MRPVITVDPSSGVPPYEQIRAQAKNYTMKQIAALAKRAGTNYNFLQWEEALQYDFPADTSKLSSDALQALEEKRARAQMDHKITGEEVRKAKSETRRAFYEYHSTLIPVARTIDAWDNLA